MVACGAEVHKLHTHRSRQPLSRAIHSLVACLHWPIRKSKLRCEVETCRVGGWAHFGTVWCFPKLLHDWAVRGAYLLVWHACHGMVNNSTLGSTRIHHTNTGRCKYLVTGASPLAPEVFEFMRICFGATVLEGYGMTETACTITLTDPADASMGHVGVPTMGCEVKLEDIPEMNYRNSDTPYPRGEVGSV